MPHFVFWPQKILLDFQNQTYISIFCTLTRERRERERGERERRKEGESERQRGSESKRERKRKKRERENTSAGDYISILPRPHEKSVNYT
jgi:hypothetical protein